MVQADVSAFVALLVVAVLASLAVQRLPVPYVTALAAIGAVGGVVIGPRSLSLSHSLILFVFLPGLLFEAAFNLEWGNLRRNMAGVIALSTVGVLLTTAVVAALGRFALGLPLAAAVIFGAAVAPTDPVAVVAVFRRLGVPARLANLVEAESLFNDGTGVVVFTVALGLAVDGSTGLGGAVLQFLELVAGGVALGVAIGFVFSLALRHMDDPAVEMTVTAIAAYGGYLAGEAAHVSGILTVVCAGVVIGNYGRSRAMSERTQTAVSGLWDYVAFLLNSLVFLLIGLDVPWRWLAGHAALIAGAAGAVLLARGVSVYGLMAGLRPLRRSVNLAWQHVIVWSGLRGAVAVALALSLPETGRMGDVRALVFGVALVTILVQGLSVGALARRLLPHSRPRPAAPAG
ncbi:MAG: cation:proton antiporter [Candidatus Dormibacterales bacterium]